MKIILNNTETELNYSQITVKELLVIKKFTFKMLVIKINDKLVKNEEYANTLIHNGDKVDVIHLISGG
ncbi:MAG TPA: sulfur carrier protein ThiS [Bacteroidales bacterium]|nr:sulfur carrier protein ThiS [Bacteroidales bacterium]